jgi:hypothetical protein
VSESGLDQRRVNRRDFVNTLTNSLAANLLAN